MMVAAPRISPRPIMSCASAMGTQRTASASSISGSPDQIRPAGHVDILGRVR